MIKKIVMVVLIIASCVFVLPTSLVYAEGEMEQLEQEVDTKLDDIDFSGLDDSAESNDQLGIMDSFGDIVKKLISGNYEGSDTIVSKIISTIFKQITSLIPIMLLIVAIAIMGNIVQSFKPTESSKAISDLIHFVCLAVVVVVIVEVFKNIYVTTTKCVDGISNQMGLLFPILLTLLTSMGSVVSASTYQPVVAVLTGGVVTILRRVLYPIFIVSLLFVVIGNMSSQVKLNKFLGFLNSCFKWIIGFVFTMFAGFLTIRGISAGRYDSISLKATRFAMKSYVPIIGGYLSEGLDYVMLSSAVVKNAVGVAGLLLMFSSVIVPLINLVLFKLALQLVAGVLEPIGDTRLSKLCEDISKIMIFPILIILSMAFMYLISVSLILCTFVGV